MKQDLESDGFCDNGDTSIWVNDSNEAHSSTTETDDFKDFRFKKLNESFDYSSLSSSTNNHDYEERATRLFKILIDYIYETLTNDDINDLKLELKPEYLKFKIFEILEFFFFQIFF